MTRWLAPARDLVDWGAACDTQALHASRWLESRPTRALAYLHASCAIARQPLLAAPKPSFIDIMA